jgi:hypothetical protein
LYEVRVALEGFITQELTEVQVRLDRRTELQVTLALASFDDEVVVTETTPVVDPTQVSTGQTFTSDYIQEAAIGSENRHYLGFLPQTAGVEGSGRLGISVLGSSVYENTYLVDGSDTNDPHDKLIGLNTLSFEAIDEIAFHTAGFEAQYGRATGGVVNLITKSGGNRFSGSFDLRYRDNDFMSRSEHFDSDEDPFEMRDINAALGGPILRDRIWFFTAMQSFREVITPALAPSTRRLDEQNYLGKLTWQASPEWNLVGRLIFNPFDDDRWNTSQFRAPEAEASSQWRGFNGQVAFNGILTENLLFGGRLSGQQSDADVFPSSGDLSAIFHRNWDTGEVYGSSGLQWYTERERQEVEADLTWFVDDFAGFHEIKGGLGYGRTGYSNDQCWTGSGQMCAAGVDGYSFRDLADETGNRLPAQLRVQTALGSLDYTGSLQSVYLQDAWRVRPDLSLSLGLRWDGSQQENDVGDEIADLDMLQPRVGLAWDVGGRGRDVLRGSWGRYMHPSRLSLAETVAGTFPRTEYWYACSLFDLNDPVLCAAVAESLGSRHRIDSESWDPAGWILDAVFFSGGPVTSPDLEPMYVNELILAYERELLRRTSLELSFVKKDTFDIIEDTCVENYPVPQPGGECSGFLLANLPDLRKSYEALMLRFESRAHDRFHVIGSYVYSESEGNHHGGNETTSGFDFFPYHFVNQYGYLLDHSRHRVKVNGFVILPLDFSVALNSWWSSEFRWAPQTRQPPVPWGRMYLEPRGSRSEPGVYQIDLQAGKAFRVGPTRLKLIATVYNALNTELVTAVCEFEVGCGKTGEPTDWQLPRRYELGVRVEF